MAAGRLTAGKNHTHNLLFCHRRVGALLEGDFVFAVGVGEQRRNLLLVSNALGGFTVLDTNLGNAVSQHTGQLGLILVSCQLQGGFFHIHFSLLLVY